MSCCVQTTGGVPDGSGAAGGPELRELVIDLRTQTPRVLATGVENMTAEDGTIVPFDCVIAAGDSWTIGVTGAVWDEGATSTAWSSGTRDATNLNLGYDDLHSLLDIDATWTYRIDAYFSALALLNTEYINVCIYGDSGSPNNAGVRVIGAGRSRQATVQVWRPNNQATGLNYTSAPGGTTNVTGLTIRSQAISVHAGTWSGTWASLRCPIQWGGGKLSDVALSNPMLDQNSRFAIALASQGIAGTSSLTLEQIRFQAREF